MQLKLIAADTAIYFDIKEALRKRITGEIKMRT
jgi:hypothetical protein